MYTVIQIEGAPNWIHYVEYFDHEGDAWTLADSFNEAAEEAGFDALYVAREV